MQISSRPNYDTFRLAPSGTRVESCLLSMAHVCIGTPKLFTKLNGSLPDPEDPMDDQRHSSDKLHVVRKRVRPPRVRAKPDLRTQRSREVLHPPRDISRLGSDIHGTSSSPKRSDKMANRRGTHHTSA